MVALRYNNKSTLLGVPGQFYGRTSWNHTVLGQISHDHVFDFLILESKFTRKQSPPSSPVYVPRNEKKLDSLYTYFLAMLWWVLHQIFVVDNDIFKIFK